MARDIGKYHSRIGRFVDELCHIYYKHSQPEDRTDISNEVALIAHQSRDKVKDRSEAEVLGWLHKIAENVIRNWSRREGRIAKHSLGSLNDETWDANPVHRMQSDSLAPDTLVLFQEKIERIRRAISELPVIYQQVIWLFYVEELREKNIAERLGIRKGTVKSRLHHARERLATRLEPYFSDQ